MNPSSLSRYDSITVRILSGLCLVLLLVSAGCSAGSLTGPSGQQRPVDLNVTNAANKTYTFNVSVVELPADATVLWSDGLNQTAELGTAGITTHDPGKYHNITAVKLPSSARLSGQYVLKSGETDRSNITNLPENFVVVVTVSHGDRIDSWVDSSCNADLVYLGVTMRYYGSDSAYDCN